MPIRCPECNEVVERKLSHGYFVTYKETDFSKLDQEVEETPKQYKSLKTGAVISADEYREMIERHDFIFKRTNEFGIDGRYELFY